jgi:23S rRNA pseudouridine955/2504/2580 synthase
MNHGTGPDKGTRQTGVQKIVVDEEQAGQRIDNFLRRQLPGLPKGRLYRILRRGEVRVNGGRIRAEYKLVAGDEVRIPPARINADPDAPAAGKVADLEQQVLYEDKRLLVQQAQRCRGARRQRRQSRRDRANAGGAAGIA